MLANIFRAELFPELSVANHTPNLGRKIELISLNSGWKLEERLATKHLIFGLRIQPETCNLQP